MANSHGLKSSIVKKQAKARKLAKGKKKGDFSVYIGNENLAVRKAQSYKARNHYMENKQKFPKKRLKSKNIQTLKDSWIIDERGFFLKWKKKNFITKSMVDEKGLDFYGMPR